MPEDLPIVLAVVAFVMVVVACFVWKVLRNRGDIDPEQRKTLVALGEPPTEFPPEGFLVPDDVFQCANSTSVSVWEALEAAAAPVAVEYHPITQLEVAKLRTVPVNAMVQQALADVVKTVGPKGPALFTAVLPQGAELVKAVGGGFRGFAQNTSGKIAAQAVLKPIGIGTAVAASWPALAVGATVMALDMMAQREQRAFQERLQDALRHLEKHYYIDRLTNQRTADALASHAISELLDGAHPSLGLMLKSTLDEFHRAQLFLDEYSGIIEGLVIDDGKIDYTKLESALGGKSKDMDYFVRELHLARSAIALQRKALLADAAEHALADPANPYVVLRRFLDSQAKELERLSAVEKKVSEHLAQIETKDGGLRGQLPGFLPGSIKPLAERCTRFREMVSRPEMGGDAEIRFVFTSSGGILQVVPPEEDEPLELEGSDPSSPVEDGENYIDDESTG